MAKNTARQSYRYPLGRLSASRTISRLPQCARLGVARALGAIGVGEGQDRDFLTAKALNGVGALDLGLQIDQTQLDALDLTHAHPRLAGARVRRWSSGNVA